MAWPEQTVATIRRLETIERELGDRYVDRKEAIRLLALATVCREHVLLIGPPGTAKTGLVDQFCRSVGARQFRYLLTRFTEPSELFGPLDIEQFQAGSYRIRTENMLPEAEIVFLDEVFQGSSAILNTLLTLLNERRFQQRRAGHGNAADQPVRRDRGAAGRSRRAPFQRSFPAPTGARPRSARTSWPTCSTWAGSRNAPCWPTSPPARSSSSPPRS